MTSKFLLLYIENIQLCNFLVHNQETLSKCKLMFTINLTHCSTKSDKAFKPLSGRQHELTNSMTRQQREMFRILSGKENNLKPKGNKAKHNPHLLVQSYSKI